MRAGEPQLNLRRVLAHIRRFALFEQAHLLHLPVGVIAVDSGSGAAGAVGHHHPGKPLILQTKAFGDAVIRHDLDIVLVRRDAQVRGTRQRRLGRRAVWNE